MLLHEVLNNTITPGGHRVINYLDVKRLVPGEDWEIGFSRGLLNSLVALPLVSSGMLEPMKKMKGTAEDRADNVCKELQIMHALMASWRQARLSLNTSLRGVHSNLREVFPILIGAPGEDSAKEGDSRNIWSGNFFEDGSSDPILAGELVEKVSPATTNAVVAFLESNGVPLSRASKQRTVASTVSHLLALDCAKLWEHEALEPEEIPEDGELWNSVQRAPPSPALSLDQLRALKAELRALVPAIHEVVDRAHQDAKRAPSLRSIASRMSGVREAASMEASPQGSSPGPRSPDRMGSPAARSPQGKSPSDRNSFARSRIMSGPGEHSPGLSLLSRLSAFSAGKADSPLGTLRQRRGLFQEMKGPSPQPPLKTHMSSPSLASPSPSPQPVEERDERALTSVASERALTSVASERAVSSVASVPSALVAAGKTASESFLLAGGEVGDA